MTIDTTNSLVHRLEIVETGRRRRFTPAEKLRIVKESHEGSRRVSATARRYGLLPARLFTWRRQYEDGRLGAEADGDPVFVPAVVRQDGVSAPGPQQGGGRLEIVVRITRHGEASARPRRLPEIPSSAARVVLERRRDGAKNG